MTSFRRLRFAQVRVSSLLMQELVHLRPFAAFVSKVRRWPLVRQAVDLVAGYNRVFPDLTSARKAVQGYGMAGADSAEDASGLQVSMEATRPSDYPVLFHLSRLQLDGLRVFDLGGTTGDLFFLYDRYVRFPASLLWTVHDLPANVERGRTIAKRRNESRLQFTDDPHAASGSDLLLVSGALHYFDFTLADYLEGLSQRPRHVLINRTPLVNMPSAATVQYAYGTVMVACRLLNRQELVSGMERLGYTLIDTWHTPEFSIRLPYDPEYWVSEYSGLYFRADAS